MVSTRNHPKQFPEPTASPTKRSVTPTLSAAADDAPAARTPSRAKRPAAAGRSASTWSHTPSNLALIWLGVSLPLVIWDCGYILLRPHTFPGGALHWPLYVPYALYERIDYAYSVKAYNDRYGFSGAQGVLNVVETLGYLGYLYIVYAYGVQDKVAGTGAPDPSKAGFLGLARTVRGREAGVACLLGLTVTVMTCSKTVLYWLIEIVSGFHGIGHNDFATIFFLWILPNGPWIPVPGYLAYVFAKEILDGLDVASSESKKLQ